MQFVRTDLVFWKNILLALNIKLKKLNEFLYDIHHFWRIENVNQCDSFNIYDE